jgi:hypothetical protein
VCANVSWALGSVLHLITYIAAMSIMPYIVLAVNNGRSAAATKALVVPTQKFLGCQTQEVTQ